MNVSVDRRDGLSRVHVVMQRVFDTTRDCIDNLDSGQKITLKKLQIKVSDILELPQMMVAPFVTAFVEGYRDCTLMRGRSGGVYKGVLARKNDDQPRCQGCGQKIRKARIEASGAVASISAKDLI